MCSTTILQRGKGREGGGSYRVLPQPGPNNMCPSSHACGFCLDSQDPWELESCDLIEWAIPFQPRHCHQEGLGLCTATLGQHLTQPGLSTSCLSRLSAWESQCHWLLTEAWSQRDPNPRPVQSWGMDRAWALLFAEEKNTFLIEDKGFSGNRLPMFSHLKNT